MGSTVFPRLWMKKTTKYRPAAVWPYATYKCSPLTRPFSAKRTCGLENSTSSTSSGIIPCLSAILATNFSCQMTSQIRNQVSDSGSDGLAFEFPRAANPANQLISFSGGPAERRRISWRAPTESPSPAGEQSGVGATGLPAGVTTLLILPPNWLFGAKFQSSPLKALSRTDGRRASSSAAVSACRRFSASTSACNASSSATIRRCSGSGGMGTLSFRVSRKAKNCWQV